MNRAGAAPDQWVVMAAIVATMLYFPAGALVGVIAYAFGVTPEGLVTLGGRIAMYAGIIGWWLIVFGASLIYAAFVRSRE